MLNIRHYISYVIYYISYVIYYILDIMCVFECIYITCLPTKAIAPDWPPTTTE